MTNIKTMKTNNYEFDIIRTDNKSLYNDLIDNKDYIIIYDESIHGEGNCLLLAPSNLNTKDYYNICKSFNYRYIVNNILEIGYVCFNWNN